MNGEPLHQVREPARALGVLLDASAFHPGRTVRETLRLGGFSIGASRRRADDCMELVGLSQVSRRRVGQLSLGMRQRLGVAHALLGRPGALVLDEPSNGLDPAGITWLDGLLRAFAADGGTVLVSTHHLAAVERTADRLIGMSRGCLVADVAVADVVSTRTFVRSPDPQLDDALRAEGGRVERIGLGVSVDLDPARVGQVIHDHGILVTELRRDHRRLDHFLATVTEQEFEGRADR